MIIRSLSKSLFGAAAMTLLIWTTAAQANLILNGDFATSVPLNGTGGNWTNFNNDGAGGWRSSGGSFDQHFILNNAGQIGTNPTIEQMVSALVINDTYIITGDVESFAPQFGTSSAPSFGVEIGSILTEFTRNQVSPGNGPGSFSVTFVANATSMLLRLTAERDPDDSSYRIDNISLNSTTVPEPGSLSLLGFGLFGLRLVYRRRRAVS